MKCRWNNTDRGKPKFCGENRGVMKGIRASASLSTTDPTWTAMGLNLCLDGSRPAINRL